MRKIIKFGRLSFSKQVIIIEALLFLILGWFIRNLLPFQWWINHVGTPGVETPLETLSSQQMQEVEALKDLLLEVSKITTPLRNCLVRSLAIRFMLRRRGYSSTLYFSIAAGRYAESILVGSHAWVRCGTVEILKPGSILKVIMPVGDKF